MSDLFQNQAIQHYVIKSLTTGHWFSLGTPIFSTNKTDRQDITEILLKVALNTINQPNYQNLQTFFILTGMRRT